MSGDRSTARWRKRPRFAVFHRARPGALVKDVAYSVGFGRKIVLMNGRIVLTP